MLAESGSMGLGTYDVEFSLRGDGNAYADGSWNGGGADYAEYFEWSDGNPNAEDRRGISVVLDGDQIVVLLTKSLGFFARVNIVSIFKETHWLMD